MSCAELDLTEGTHLPKILPLLELNPCQLQLGYRSELGHVYLV